MKRIQHILLPLDVTGEGFGKGERLPARVRTAIAEAAWVRQAFGARLTVLAVVEAADTPALRKAALERLRVAVAPELQGVQAEYAVEVGAPFVEIIRCVRRLEVDLVMVASRRPSLMDRAVVGSTALRLLRKCPCAVWVAARRPEGGPWGVLAAIGSSGLARTLLELSADLVKRRKGEWHVLHCVEYAEEGALRLQHRPQEEIDAYRKGVREEDWSTMRSLVADASEKTGVTPQLWLAEGDPVERIERAIDEQDIHLVVMGTIGRGGLPGLIMGNTAEKLFKRVGCSVLALKPEGFVSPVS